ncbi:SagB/ThcOx family dehydrogenase, partial [Streptomyces sp. NPDC127110]|uniref:SagB/ThcOx family dehydrogenase n=1 Tax=Streptomyces sp. NPDC127110 TaxID=3345362 RepID=UPI0036449E30
AAARPPGGVGGAGPWLPTPPPAPPAAGAAADAAGPAGARAKKAQAEQAGATRPDAPGAGNEHADAEAKKPGAEQADAEATGAEAEAAGPVGATQAGAEAERAGAEAAREWGRELRLLCNRLGVDPDEERAVYRLAAHALLDTGEPAEYFPEGHLAPDWQYLERSKVRPGWDAGGALRPAPAEAAEDGEVVALPGGAVPEVPLWAAVTGRTSVRTGLSGPLDAGELGTLLWGAHAVSHTSDSGTPFAHRPYPSPGGLYAAGIRLFAFGVAGLAPGAYQCLPGRRALLRVGDAPALDEFKAVSAYLAAPPGDPRAVVVDGVPVVLGLYVDLGRLRQRYGLRALRLGLLEAGHLAQSLLLTASALGLHAMPLGGFEDDLAHELFGLDDLDRPLQYLLPLGRPATA